MTACRIIFIAATVDADLGGIARSVPALAAAVAAAQGAPDAGRATAGRVVTLLAPRAKRDTLGSIGGMASVDVRLSVLGPDAPVIVVPNGIEAPPAPGDPQPVAAAGRVRRILFLSRIHPKKGVLDLIQAFGQLSPDGWELLIAGNDDGGHQSACERMAAAQPNHSRIRFAGPVADAAKWDLYRSADLFVLPSYSENFGIVVGEALGCGVPVITTTATPWGEYARAEARRGNAKEADLGLWVVATGVAAIRDAMLEAIGLGDERRRAIGACGARWIRDQFSWQATGRQFSGEVKKRIPEFR